MVIYCIVVINKLFHKLINYHFIYDARFNNKEKDNFFHQICSICSCRDNKIVDVIAVRWQCDLSLRERWNQCAMTSTLWPPLFCSIPWDSRSRVYNLYHHAAVVYHHHCCNESLLLLASPSSSSSPSHHEFGVRRSFRTCRRKMCFRFITLSEWRTYVGALISITGEEEGVTTNKVRKRQLERRISWRVKADYKLDTFLGSDREYPSIVSSEKSFSKIFDLPWIIRKKRRNTRRKEGEWIAWKLKLDVPVWTLRCLNLEFS